MEKETLQKMPISQLRAMDIKSLEEELLVQEVLNEKLLQEPQIDLNKPIFPSEKTDKLNPETEAKLQAELDGELKEIEESPVVAQVQEEIQEPVKEPEVKRFCEFCNAKGPIKHQNSCTRKTAQII